MKKKEINRVLDFLYQYKLALLEKVSEKVMETLDQDGDIQYSLGNFAIEDFMDSQAMRLSHLNMMILEFQHQLEGAVEYEKLRTSVYEIPKQHLKTKVPYYLNSIAPDALKWVHLEKVEDDLYYLFVTYKTES